jgi:molybdopterin synthase sulfur carrier subunit
MVLDDSMTQAPATFVTISVRMVYLARLREALGLPGETLTIAADEPPSVASIEAILRARGGVFFAELAPGRAVRFAVNHRLAHHATAVHDGDEVAVFPPVTGG